MQKKRFLWVGSIAFVMFVYMLIMRKVWLFNTFTDFVRIFADAFTLPGMILMLIGALLYVTKRVNKRFTMQCEKNESKAKPSSSENGAKELYQYTFVLLIVGVNLFVVAVILNAMFSMLI